MKKTIVAMFQIVLVICAFAAGCSKQEERENRSDERNSGVVNSPTSADNVAPQNEQSNVEGNVETLLEIDKNITATLTITGMNPDSLDSVIKLFNSEFPNVIVEKDALESSNLNTGSAAAKAQTRLNTKILSGQAGDIIMGFNSVSLFRQSILADLHDFIIQFFLNNMLNKLAFQSLTSASTITTLVIGLAVTMLLPLQAIIVPHYMVASFLNLSPYLSIVLPAVFNPLGTIILFQFCRAVPAELTEAAKIDGAGHVRILLNIILPLMKNGIITLAVLLSVENWNIIDQAVVFIDNVYAQPLSVYLVEIARDNMGVIFAASVIFMLPMLLIYNSFKENFSQGIQMSAGIK